MKRNGTSFVIRWDALIFKEIYNSSMTLIVMLLFSMFQEMVHAKDPPSHYLTKLRTYLDPKASRSHRVSSLYYDDLERSIKFNFTHIKLQPQSEKKNIIKYKLLCSWHQWPSSHTFWLRSFCFKTFISFIVFTIHDYSILCGYVILRNLLQKLFNFYDDDNDDD